MNTETRDPGLIWAYALPLSLFLALVLFITQAPAFAIFMTLGAAVVSSIMGARYYHGAFPTIAVIISGAMFILTGALTLAEIVSA